MLLKIHLFYNMKYHYVYIITNKLNHKFYIGKHSTDDLDDGYMGSGIAINKAIQKYGIENFSKRILCFCDSAEDAYKVEEFLVTDNLIKREDCYNMKTGGTGGFPEHYGEKNPFFGKHHSEQQKQKWRENRKGKNTGKDNPMFGKHHSEQQKKKWSDERKGKTSWNKGIHISCGWKNKNHHSEETIQKLKKPKQKFKWLTPTGEIKEMAIGNVKYHHPDWVMVEQ